MPFELIQKPHFINQLLTVPYAQIPPILEKIESVLREDPRPHATQKKKLHGYQGNVYRLRCGDWRIIYTFGDGWVTLLGVDNRKDVYKGERLVDEGPSTDIHPLPDMDAVPTSLRQPTPPYSWADAAPAPAATAPASVVVADKPLDRPIDAALLNALRVPERYRPALLACATEDALLNADVPQDLVTRVVDALFAPDFDSVLTQPDYLLPAVDDLLRFREGELLGFLLKLSPEQEKFVTWALNASGPTLVKGGPGTGKSTIALYRVRSVLRTLRAAGNPRPRILFTTYTNALIAYSRQLLESLIGDEYQCVDVRTADSLSMWIMASADGIPRIAPSDELRRLIAHAMTTVTFEGTVPEQAAQLQTIQRLGAEYLLEEITSVIQARQLPDVEMYLMARRGGRRLALNATQRRAIWCVSEVFTRLLAERRLLTWEQARARAEEIVRSGGGSDVYDAVIVDEAQDLDPSTLRMLVELCRAPNRLFITADANQSIYGSSFRWTSVHESLQFRGRTGVLRANFRSTREIGEAAHSYLASGMLDYEQTEREYRHTGVLPAVHGVVSGRDECDLLARYLPAAARECRLGVAACAVLCPSERAGRWIAAELTAGGLSATFMTGKNLDLAYNGIKVITLKSAKGLEFPVVALAGFPSVYPSARAGATEEQQSEVLPRERRTLFVGMTRAMRALLVVVPAGTRSPLLTGFDPAYWNLGRQGARA